MLKKILLICSLLGPAIGFSDLGAASQWGVAIPLGAVCFILFFVLTLLEKEVALYDAEQRQKSANLTPSFSVKPIGNGVWQTS